MAFTVGVGSAVANTGSGTTLAVTLAGTTTGYHVIIGVGWESSSITLNSITCSGETVTLIGSPSTGGGMRTQLAYVSSLTAGGSKTFTANFSSSVSGAGIFAMEFTGGDTSSLLDASTTATATSANPSTTLTTGADNTLVVATEMNTSGAPTPGSGYTAISGTSSWSKFFKAQYNLDAGTAGSETVDWANATSNTWIIAAASFKGVDNTREGTLTKTEASDTLAATGAVAVNGSLTKTEASDTVAAEGVEGSFVVGALTKTEAADIVSSAGNVPVNGSVVKTEAQDLISFTGTVANTGNATGTLPMLTILASSGDGADITLPFLTIEADGIAGAAGTLESILPALQSTGIGTGDNTGTLAVDLPALTLVAGDGGGLIETLPAIVLDATSLTGGVGALTDALPALTLTAVGDFTNIGTSSAALSSLQGYATGVHGVVAEAAIVLPALRLETAGEAGETATAALVLPLLTLSAAGHPPSTGTAMLVLPSLLLSASGAPTFPATYRTWVVNLKTRAVTEYTGFAFNSYANFDGRVLAASGSGVFELNSATADNTTDIDAVARTGKHAYDTSYLKRVPRLYLSYSAPSGDLEVRTITSEDGRRRYLLRHNGITGVQQRRVPVGKGPKSKFWQFEVANRNGSDFELDGVIVYPQVLGVRAQ